MALGSTIEAIVTRWTAAGLDSTVTGGLHLHEAPQETVQPYCVLQEPAADVEGRAARKTGSGRYATVYENTFIRFVLHVKTGATAAKAMAAAIKAAFSNATLAVSGATLVDVTYMAERMVPNHTEQWPNSVLWAIEYEIKTAEAENLAPS